MFSKRTKTSEGFTFSTFIGFLSCVSPFMCVKSLISIGFAYIVYIDRASLHCGLFHEYKVKLKNWMFSHIPYFIGFLSTVISFMFFQNTGDNRRLSHTHYICLASLHNSDTHMACVQFDIWCAYFGMNDAERFFHTHCIPMVLLQEVFLFRLRCEIRPKFSSYWLPSFPSHTLSNI